MLTAEKIKKILSTLSRLDRTTSPTITLSITQIQEYVKQNYDLTPEDWAPHTRTRPTTYPQWKHRIQSVLSELKRNEIISQDDITHKYIFYKSNMCFA